MTVKFGEVMRQSYRTAKDAAEDTIQERSKEFYLDWVARYGNLALQGDGDGGPAAALNPDYLKRKIRELGHDPGALIYNSDLVNSIHIEPFSERPRGFYTELVGGVVVTDEKFPIHEFGLNPNVPQRTTLELTRQKLGATFVDALHREYSKRLGIKSAP